jgi:plastocyanin
MSAQVATPRLVPPKRAARREGVLIALGALGVSLLFLTPLALTRLRQDAVTLQEPAVIVQIAAEGLRFVPDGMRVPAGASVRVEFTNNDPTSPHDFQTIGQYRDARIVLWPGESRASGFIAANRPGRYSFICTIRTGTTRHADIGMVGTIIVE